MSGPFGSSQWMYSSGAAFYPFAIDQSLRFNDNDSAYLSRTPASAGNRKTWTWSGWVKRGNLGGTQSLFGAYTNVDNRLYINYSSDIISIFGRTSGATNISVNTGSAVFRDTSAWYHVVCAIDTTQSTGTDRVKLYINGTQQTLTFATTPSQNSDLYVNTTQQHRIGDIDGSLFFDGYLAEVNFIDGQALDASSFGEFKSGVWIPKDPSGLTYGTNGFRLSFADSSNIGDDTSGNTNDWTANSLVATDVLLDSPTNNFAVLNPLTGQTNVVLSEGNLAGRATANYRCSIGNFGMSSGKWYFEGMVGSSAAISLNATGLGIATDGVNLNSYLGDNTTDWGYIANTGAIYNGVNTGNRSVPTNGSIIGVAYDADNGDLYFSLNGVWQDSGAAIGTGLSGTWYPAVGYQSDSNIQMILNTGQDSSFAGNKTAQGNTDANGIGDFYYAPPSGYLALCTANLPDPVIDPAQDDVPADYFNAVLWTGDDSASRNITGFGFDPDFVWSKTRNEPHNHRLTDKVRGAAEGYLSSNTTSTPSTAFGRVLSFITDGIEIGYTSGDANGINGVGDTTVAWAWLAGNGTSSNTSGSITSTVSVNQKAGFAVVSYTGNGTAGATVGHGLGVTPNLWITKNRSSGTADWVIKTSDMASNEWLRFKNDAKLTTLTGNTANSSVITTGGNTVDNASGQDFIVYAFHSVEGYSRYGQFIGNGSLDGPFVFTGHAPAWLLIKNLSSLGEWMMYDNARSTFNPIDREVYANASDAEATVNRGDMLSNGFKIRSTSTSLNTSGNTYIYMAFAENPFKYSLAR